MDKKKIILSRIADHLIININSLDALGLFHGKMGVALFFSHYARYTGLPAYDDWAGILVDQIYKEIHHDILFNFNDGLLGIGWGIADLLENRFMEGEPGSVLDSIDNKVMALDIRRVSDWSEFDGLGGILHYVLKRISLNYLLEEKILPFDSLYLSELESTCISFKEKEADTGSYEGTLRAVDTFLAFRKSGVLAGDRLLSYTDMIKNVTDMPSSFSDYPLGIADGFAGLGLKYMIQ